MFTQVRTHFTFNTPRLIVHTCSEDCSGFTKYFSCPPLKNFLIFFGGVRNPWLTSRERPHKQGEKFRLWSRQTDSFLCRHEKFSGIVWTPIWYVTLHFRDPRGAASLVTEIAMKSAFLFVNRSLIRYGFYAGAKAIRFCVNIASDCQTEDRIPPNIWKIDQLYQMAGVTKHATRIVIFLPNPLCAFI